MILAPSLFIPHGSPMFALLPGELGPRLRALGARLNGIHAVLVVSPHRQTRGVQVRCPAPGRGACATARARRAGPGAA